MQKLGLRLKERLSRSAFFLGAVLFHLVLFLMLIGYVVWPHPPADEPSGFTEIPSRPAVPTPPVHAENAEAKAAGADVGIHEISLDTLDAGSSPAPTHLITDPLRGLDPSADIDNGPVREIPVRADPISHQPRVDMPGVAQTVKSWIVPGRPGFMKFPIYIAKYADGDWDCNIYLHDGQPASGSLPNLMARIHDWSHGELDGREIRIVDLASPEILNHPPPFIFFTGHKDFHLTAAEIDNLRKYLLIGGALWGDSAFAGDGSRFDVAFHREMKSVLPDKDLPFEDITLDHDIFARSRFVFTGVPAGMNRRADSLQCINFDGKIAVLYTPNDYSDMLTMLLQPGLAENEARMDGWNHWTPDHPLFTNGFLVWHAASYFRNYQPDSAMSAYKLSMNILFYLVHRYDDDLELTN
jgi:hypothetical protein